MHSAAAADIGLPFPHTESDNKEFVTVRKTAAAIELQFNARSLPGSRPARYRAPNMTRLLFLRRKQSM